MHLYISIALAALAVILLVSPDTLIDKNTSNGQMKMVYDNSMMIGLGLAAVAYYVYTLQQPKASFPATATETTTEMSELPSYEEATSEGN
ncbi:MAG: hypothetical protein EBU90_08085 [Proteobacteria bacterium]|nr:hypothetical protein [Pseudomonadota bacterium]NBP15279.1 hypothetical protein [bacterium]